ncbi:MAG TPA: tetratricopeptide repeat protein [Sphingomicrobium sp.]|nr:tetratricopeptide repeat protein [Sphingomicrobium sp.]
MRSLKLAAGVVLVVQTAAVMGATLTMGGPLSQLCYQAALTHDDRSSSMDACNRSLNEEALTVPDRAATLNNRGILRMRTGRLAEADADFDAALAIDRNAPDPWLNKAFLRLRAGNGREALPLLDEGIKRRPARAALAYFARGLAYEDLGNFEAAYADLQRARELEPRWALPARYLARYRVQRDR